MESSVIERIGQTALSQSLQLLTEKFTVTKRYRDIYDEVTITQDNEFYNDKPVEFELVSNRSYNAPLDLSAHDLYYDGRTWKRIIIDSREYNERVIREMYRCWCSKHQADLLARKAIRDTIEEARRFLDGLIYMVVGAYDDGIVDDSCTYWYNNATDALRRDSEHYIREEIALNISAKYEELGIVVEGKPDYNSLEAKIKRKKEDMARMMSLCVHP